MNLARSPVSLVASALVALLLFESCGGQVARDSSPPATASAPGAEQLPAEATDDGPVRWPWITLGVVVAASAAIALIFAYVIVPEIGESAGEAAANSGSGDGTGGGILGLTP